MAGHETSGHAISFAFAALAVYPEIQQKALEEVRAVMSEGQLPVGRTSIHSLHSLSNQGVWQSYSDVARFAYIQAIFYEALRMFPPVIHIPKESAFDTTLRTKNKNGETVVIPCPKGTQINMSSLGVHFNRKLVQHSYNIGTKGGFTAKYWHDPKTFNPDRFLGDWNRDAFIPFSAGARSCIGRRYANILFHLKRE